MTFMEENLDYYAQTNALRDVNCYLKFVLGMELSSSVLPPRPRLPRFLFS